MAKYLREYSLINSRVTWGFAIETAISLHVKKSYAISVEESGLFEIWNKQDSVLFQSYILDGHVNS